MRLIDWLIFWFVDWLVGWLVLCLTVWFSWTGGVDWFDSCDCLLVFFIWLFGLLGWLIDLAYFGLILLGLRCLIWVDCLIHWLVGCLADCEVSWLRGRLADWLIDWLLIDWLDRWIDMINLIGLFEISLHSNMNLGLIEVRTAGVDIDLQPYHHQSYAWRNVHNVVRYMNLQVV